MKLFAVVLCSLGMVGVCRAASVQCVAGLPCAPSSGKPTGKPRPRVPTSPPVRSSKPPVKKAAPVLKPSAKRLPSSDENDSAAAPASRPANVASAKISPPARRNTTLADHLAKACYKSITSAAYDLAMKQCLEATQADPAYAVPYFYRGKLHSMNLQLEKALDEYTRFLELSPRDLDGLHNRGAVYFKAGKYDLAIKDYERALELNPQGYDGAHVDNADIAKAYMQQAMYDLAIPYLQAAVRLNPKNYEYHTDLGICLFNIKQYDLAVAEYNKSIELFPEGQAAKARLIETQNRKAEVEKQIADKTTEFESGKLPFSALTDRARIYFHEKQLVRAADDLARALDLDPTYVPAHHLRGQVYLAEKRYEAAIVSFSKAIDLDPNYVNAYVKRGQGLLERNQPERALSDLNVAISKLPSEPEAYRLRARVYDALGRSAEAQADRKRVADLSAGAPSTVKNQ
jgi:tetratricopeptide (TPR) repeat protein